MTIYTITRIKNVWPKSIYFIALDQINTHLKISVSEKVISSMFGNFGKEKEFAMFRWGKTKKKRYKDKKVYRRGQPT